MRWMLFALGALWATTACATKPNVTAGQLPLRRVVVYRNGVGYFERSGRVNEDEVEFRMRQSTVGDFLATLAIVEQGGSSVRSASFPIEVKDEMTPTPPPALCTPEMQPEACFVAALRSPPPPQPVAKPKDPLRRVVLRLDGKRHDLAVGYIAETPLWRPSYRVVIGSSGKAELQAWGIVQNLSGEDWQNVKLVLVAGAPLAFQSTLGNPITPERPVVTDTGEVIAAVPEGVTSLEEDAAGEVARYEPEAAPPPAPEPEAVLEEEAEPPGTRMAKRKAIVSNRQSQPATGEAPPPLPGPSRGDKSEGYGYAFNDDPLALGPLEAPHSAAPSPPRNVSALAAVLTGAGTTRYAIPYPVTIPDKSATMVLLGSHAIPGESVLLFAPDGGVPDSAAHPFRVARFKNATKGILERGPIAVFEQGAFLGQGMLDPLPVGGTATVPFALERGAGVEQSRDQDERGARLAKIEAGELTIERDEVARSTYKIRNGLPDPVKVLIRHPREPGTRLYRPPPGTEDNTGTGVALVPMDVRAHGRAELIVDERRPVRRRVDWLSPQAAEGVTAYLADPRADQNTVAKLRVAWQAREDWRKLVDERTTLTAEQRELENHASQLRQSLEAIRKNAQAADLRQKLNGKLEAVLARLEQLTRRLVELTLALREQEVRFRDAILEIKVLTVPPPQD